MPRLRHLRIACIVGLALIETGCLTLAIREGKVRSLVHDEPVRLADIADGKGTLVVLYRGKRKSIFSVTEYLQDDEDFLISDGRRGSMPCSVCVTATSTALREWNFRAARSPDFQKRIECPSTLTG